MGGSRPARRRSEGGRGGGGGLRLVAVAGCGATSRPVGSASARAAAPGSLAGLPLGMCVYARVRRKYIFVLLNIVETD
jgi:hypothetical protein